MQEYALLDKLLEITDNSITFVSHADHAQLKKVEWKMELGPNLLITKGSNRLVIDPQSIEKFVYTLGAGIPYHLSSMSGALYAQYSNGKFSRQLCKIVIGNPKTLDNEEPREEWCIHVLEKLRDHYSIPFEKVDGNSINKRSGKAVALLFSIPLAVLLYKLVMFIIHR